MYNSDPCSVFLAIATNIPQRIKTGFVVQGHIYIYIYICMCVCVCVCVCVCGHVYVVYEDTNLYDMGMT